MDKRKTKSYRDRLLARRESLFSQVTEAEMSSRERDLEATQDPADMAANAYTKELLISMSANDRKLLQLIDEALEAAMLADHANWTNIGDLGGGAIGLGSTAITVSASNIDDIIRAIRREINKANGQKLAAQNGIFIIWRPADFELLEAFIQANGFVTADTYLRNGAVSGLFYGGVYHYFSNDLTAGHLFAGVKGVEHLGICRTTYGQVTVTQDPPATGAGALSGIGVISRVDYAFKTWSNVKPVLFDINVA